MSDRKRRYDRASDTRDDGFQPAMSLEDKRERILNRWFEERRVATTPGYARALAIMSVELMPRKSQFDDLLSQMSQHGIPNLNEFEKYIPMPLTHYIRKAERAGDMALRNRGLELGSLIWGDKRVQDRDPHTVGDIINHRFSETELTEELA